MPTKKQDTGTPTEGSAAKPAGPTGAVMLLKAEHRHLEELLRKFKKATTPEEKESLADQLLGALGRHVNLEEELLFPSLKDRVPDQILGQVRVENDLACLLMRDIRQSAQEDEFKEAKMLVLGDQLRRHIQSMERNSDNVFARCRKAGVDLSALENRIRSQKDSAEATGTTRTTQVPVPMPMILRPYGAGSPNGSTRYDFMDKEDTMRSHQENRERDDRGRFMSEDEFDYRRGSRGTSHSSSPRREYRNDDRERDEEARFMSSRRSSGDGREYGLPGARRQNEDDDRSGNERGRTGGYRDRYEDDDDDRSYRYESRSGERTPGRERDDEGRFVSGSRSDGRSYDRERDDEGRFLSGSRSGGTRGTGMTTTTTGCRVMNPIRAVAPTTASVTTRGVLSRRTPVPGATIAMGTIRTTAIAHRVTTPARASGRMERIASRRGISCPTWGPAKAGADATRTPTVTIASARACTAAAKLPVGDRSANPRKTPRRPAVAGMSAVADGVGKPNLREGTPAAPASLFARRNSPRARSSHRWGCSAARTASIWP